MELDRIIQDLHAERVRIQNLIVTLEELSKAGIPASEKELGGKRGGKSIRPPEHQKAIALIRNYRATRFREKSAAA